VCYTLCSLHCSLCAVLSVQSCTLHLGRLTAHPGLHPIGTDDYQPSCRTTTLGSYLHTRGHSSIQGTVHSHWHPQHQQALHIWIPHSLQHSSLTTQAELQKNKWSSCGLSWHIILTYIDIVSACFSLFIFISVFVYASSGVVVVISSLLEPDAILIIAQQDWSVQ